MNFIKLHNLSNWFSNEMKKSDMTERTYFEIVWYPIYMLVLNKIMVYSKIYIILIFWIYVASGSDFRSGFRTSPQQNSVDTRKHEVDDNSDNSTEREEKSKLNFPIIDSWFFIKVMIAKLNKFFTVYCHVNKCMHNFIIIFTFLQFFLCSPLSSSRTRDVRAHRPEHHRKLIYIVKKYFVMRFFPPPF